MELTRLPPTDVARAVPATSASKVSPRKTTSSTSMDQLRSLLPGSTSALRMTVAKWTPCAATKASVSSVLRLGNGTGRAARATRAVASTRPENRAVYRVASTAPVRRLPEKAKHAATTSRARPVVIQMNARRLRLEDSSSMGDRAYLLSAPQLHATSRLREGV